MTRIVPYLMFSGNCREAMTFYKDCLGGEVNFMPIGSSPMAESMPAEMHDKIMHSSLTKGGLELNGSDMAGPNGVNQGDSVSLTLNCDTNEEIQGFYAKLSEGANVTCPLGPAFWGGTFAHLIDKYGTIWMLTCEVAVS